MASSGASRHSTRARAVSYREPSSSAAEEEDDDYVSNEPPTKKRRATVTRKSQHNTRTAASIPALPTRSRRSARATNINAPQKSVAASSPVQINRAPQTIPSDGTIPDWASLPHEILVSIFQYASRPLRDHLLLKPQPSVNWLLNMARLCRAFKEPALTALYESPPLFELDGPHQLFALLSSDEAQLSMPYASKIKKFEVDVNRTLVYTAPGRGLIDLAQLIQLMPQLSEANFQDTSDKPPYRLLHRGKTWTYPHELFHGMSTSGIQLSKWHWNAHMIKQLSADNGFPDSVAEMLVAAHETSALKQITELCLSKFPRCIKKRRNENQPADLASRMERVLAPLKKLRALSLIHCAAFEKAWSSVLPALPTSLRSLTVANTQYLDAATLQTYLSSHGRQLQNLVLDHNRYLDLSFISDLKDSCPQLESLRMDFAFYNQITEYEDNKPLFDALLLPDQQLAWPSSLRSLELYNMRQWTSDAAENFFMSLIDSADDLPCLRRLIVKAILNIGWRDRAGFRETWIGRLRTVFLRRSPDPSPHLASKRAFRESGRPEAAIEEPAATPEDVEMTDETQGLGEGLDGGRTRRSRRLKAHQTVRRKSVDSQDSDRSVESLQRQNWKLPSNSHIQGLCEVVDISIDNSRPGEVQFTEGDFLDSDPGEDEAYTEPDEPTSEPND